MRKLSYKEAVENNSEFYFTDNLCKRGHEGRRFTKNRDCVECRNLRYKNWYKDNQERLSNEAKEFRRNNLEQVMVTESRGRAKKIGVPHEITVDDIFIPTHCPILGIPLYIGDGYSTDNSPSIDRIEPSRGYVPGNVHVISYRANTIKNSATIDELGKIYNYFLNLK